jgi:uncharacterized protein
MDRISYLVILFALYAFAGWLIESAYVSLQKKRLVNRGVLYGPFIPIYGFGSMAIVFSIVLVKALLRTDRLFFLFEILVAIFVTTILEYLTALLLEKLLKVKIWDYSKQFMNYKGRISLMNSLIWGTLAYVLVAVVQPLLSAVVNGIPESARRIAAIAFLCYLPLDAVASLFKIAKIRQTVVRFYETSVRSMHEATRKYRRLLLAVPGLTLTRIGRAKEDVRVFAQRIAAPPEKPNALRLAHRAIIEDLLALEPVARMREFHHHSGISCYDHCLRVSYYAYRLARAFRVDPSAPARAGMLHDMFLYDWKTTKTPGTLHAFSHPRSALANAEAAVLLTETERDAILKHMWPLTPALPRHRASFLVGLADKLATVADLAATRR